VSKVDSLKLKGLWISAMADTEEDLDALFDSIEIPADIRDARYAAVKDMQKVLAEGGGEYTEITEEREVLELTAKAEKCIVHFMHPDFRTCAIMSEHLKTLAKQHFKTRFYYFQADKGHWVAGKLKVRMLPAVLSFVGGVCKDRIHGFDELGNTEAFETKVLEARLAKSGVISLASEGAAAAASTRIFGFAKKRYDDDSDDE